MDDGVDARRRHLCATVVLKRRLQPPLPIGSACQARASRSARGDGMLTLPPGVEHPMNGEDGVLARFASAAEAA
jgi:hypothetical protein